MSSATGGRLTNGTITIHDVMTDALVVTLSSDFFGEASVFLPAGRYFMRQSSMPQGYLTNLDRIPFTINAGDITDMAIAVRAEPTPPTPAPTPTPPLHTQLADAILNTNDLVIITITWPDENPVTETVFVRYPDSDIWTMFSRDGSYREVFPTFKDEGTAFVIGFPVTTQRLYFLWEDGRGRFGMRDGSRNERLTWVFSHG